jgi:hypothetical protein
MQRAREFEIVGMCPVERDIAAVDDEVRPRGVDVFTQSLEICSQFGETAGKMRV